MRIFLSLCLLLGACGTSTDRQTKSVEKLTTVTGPVIVDTPVGQITMQPVKHELIRTQHEVSTEQTRIDAPEVAQAVSVAGSSLGGFGAVGGVLGLLGTAAAGWQALRLRRQRDEVISGVERAKGAMDEATWERVKDRMAAAQSDDTQRVIYDKTP